MRVGYTKVDLVDTKNFSPGTVLTPEDFQEMIKNQVPMQEAQVLVLEFVKDTVYYDMVKNLTSSVEIQTFAKTFYNFFLFYDMDLKKNLYKIARSGMRGKDETVYYVSVFPQEVPMNMIGMNLQKLREYPEVWLDYSNEDVLDMISRPPEEDEVITSDDEGFQDFDSFCEETENGEISEIPIRNQEAAMDVRRNVFENICRMMGKPIPPKEEMEKLFPSKKRTLPKEEEKQSVTNDEWEQNKKKYLGVFNQEKLLHKDIGFYRIGGLSELLGQFWMEGTVITLKGDPEKKYVLSRMPLEDFFEPAKEAADLWKQNPDLYDVLIPSVHEWNQKAYQK